MSRPGFFNENINRSYPFVHGSSDGLPLYAIADLGFVMRSGAEYVAGQHLVTLFRITLIGQAYCFDFSSDAPGLAGKVLRFCRDVSSPRFVTSHAEAVNEEDLLKPSSSSSSLSSSSSSLSSSSSSLSGTESLFPDECPNDPIWAGFLVTGDISQFLLDYPTGLTGAFPVEPSRILDIGGTYARSINVANAERTRADTKAECRDYCWPFPSKEHYVACECVIGDVKIRPGYNMAVRQEPTSNTIVIDAEVGGGLGEPCDELQIFPGEVPPINRSRLDGSLSCGEVVRSINGVGNKFFNVTGGTGVVITPVPELNKLVVDVDLHDLALCPDIRDENELPCVPVNPDPCDCGPVVDPGCVVSSSSSAGSSTTVDPPTPTPTPSSCPLVVNFDFSDRLTGWAQSGTVVWTEWPMVIVPISVIMLPSVRLLAEDGKDAFIEKVVTGLSVGTLYHIVFFANYVSGNNRFRIASGAGGLLASGKVTADAFGDGGNYKSITVVAVDDTFQVRFTSLETLTTSGRGIMDVGEMCVEV